ncbi:MAG: hypothetical protein Q7S33_01855 [Nanoarchaeota archaeon]|nr:hypothetical protein [Nanoarchaeota archaeon]
MIKNLLPNLVLAGSLLLPASATSQNVENYMTKQIFQYEQQGNKTKALATEYKLEEIKKAKKIWKQNGTLYPLNQISNPQGSYNWDKTEIGLASSYVLFSALDAYQTTHIPKGFHEGGKSYLFNLNNSPFGASRFIGNHPTTNQMITYTAISDIAWLVASDLIPKHITNHFLPEKYNKHVRKAMLSLSLSNIITNTYYNEKNTGGIVFKKAF